MESPRIYVASLSDYNNGRLEGKWLDFSDYSDASELMVAIQEMLDEITEKYNDGEVREEWAVHDYEYIPSTLASEYMGESDFQQIYDVMEVADERNIPMEVLMERVGDTGNDDYQSVADSLMFVVSGNDESDIVHEYESQIGEFDFDFWQNHIYIDSVTERVMYGEDVDRFREDIQYENPDMDEDEVERLAEEQADEEESRRNDDLVGYLEEMGYTDIPSWVSKDYESAWENALSYDFDVINHDGEMYVFSSNYGIGGVVIGGLVGAYIGYKVAENKKAKSQIRKAKGKVKRLGKKIKSKFDEGGQVQISEQELDKIRQVIAEEQAKNKGFVGRMQDNISQSQVSPKEAMQFVKDNPEVLKLLKFLEKGGKVDSENYEMLRGKIKELMHHAEELKTITNRKKEVPAWVLAKSTRASTDLSDITHYMDGNKFAKGGGVEYKEQQINDFNTWDNDEIANFLGVSISQVAKDRQRYIREAQSVMMLDSYGEGGGIDEYINIDKMNPKQYEIVTNFNTLKSLAKNGFIELHEKTGLRYKNYESKDKFRTNRVTNVRHDYIKSAKQPKFKFNNRDYAIGYIKGLNFLNLYVLKDISENKYEEGGGVDEMYFFLVNDKNDKFYKQVGYAIGETIKDNKGNEFEKLYFENKKLPKKYNVKDLIFLYQKDDFTTKDGKQSWVLLGDYESSKKPYYYLYDLMGKYVATQGDSDWMKTSLPKGWKFYGWYGEGGGVDSKRKQLEHRLWNERGYDYKYLNSLSLKELNSLYDTEFYYDVEDDQFSEGGGVDDLKNRIKMDSEIMSLLYPNERQFLLQSDTKVIENNRGMIIITDGKREIVFSKYKTKFKKLGNATSSSKELFNKKYDNGGNITDYDWANEFRKTKKYFVVLLAEENGEEEIFEGNVQARSESEALSEARRGFEFNYPNKMIKKVSIDKTKDTNRYEQGGNVSGLNDLIYG